jgi:hypothetical protein
MKAILSSLNQAIISFEDGLSLDVDNVTLLARAWMKLFLISKINNLELKGCL